MSSLTINLEIGHEASLRSKTTSEGFTHDWEVYVRGANNADIHHYVEKVVFHLHETFPKPKRVVKEPPYSLKTSGYAGFNLPIEIYLRNNQDPRKIKFTYDLQLQPNGPTIHKVQKEKYVFISPSDEFRSKLLKGGAIIGSSSSHENSEIRSNIDEKNQMTSKPKLSTSSLDVLKKPKYRPDTNRDSFQNLFGTPITKTNKQEVVKPKEQSQSKNQPSIKPEKEKSKNKSPYKDKEKTKDKQPSNESKTKEERKNKDKPKEHERNKEKKREKSRDRSVTPKEKDIKERDRKEEKKSKKEKREHKENKHRDREKNEMSHKDHKSRDVSKLIKENHLTKDIKESSPLPQPKTERKEKLKEIMTKDEEKQRTEEKTKHKYKKKDKERKEKKEEKSHKSIQDKKIGQNRFS